MIRTNKDSKMTNLINSYCKYSNFLFNFQKHIDKCCEKYIINIKDRNNYIKTINDVTRQLNTTYNMMMIEIYDQDGASYKNEMNADLTHLHKVLGIHEIKDPFNEINTMIIDKLGSFIGFPDIDTALSVIIDEQYKYIYDTEINNLIIFYNKIFVPLAFRMETIINSEIIIFFKKKISTILFLFKIVPKYILNTENHILY